MKKKKIKAGDILLPLLGAAVFGVLAAALILKWIAFGEYTLYAEIAACAMCAVLLTLSVVSLAVCIEQHTCAYTMSEIDRADGIEFEQFLAELFEKLGYQVELTPPSNDFGADLIIVRDGEATAVQAKRYSDPVGISAVQEVLGAMYYYNTDKMLVVTNSVYTPAAKALAEACGAELWNRKELSQMVELTRKA